MSFKPKFSVDDSLLQKIVTEMMTVLAPGLPRPKIKINNSQGNTLGLCHWQYGMKDGALTYWDNTEIEIQKRVIGDERTLRRIIFHEGCHHEDFLINEVADLKKYGYHTYKMMRGRNRDGGHGSKWMAIAQRFNAKYGANFVTKTSDQDTVTDDTNLRPFYVLISADTSGRKLGWQVSLRLSAKQKQYLGDCAEGKMTYPKKLFMSTDPILLKYGSPMIKYNGSSIPRTDEQKSRLQELWDSGKDILQQFKPKPIPDTAGMPRRFSSVLLQKKAVRDDYHGIDVHPINWKQPVDALRAELKTFIEEGYVWLQTPFRVINRNQHPGGEEFSTHEKAEPLWNQRVFEMIDTSNLVTMQPMISAEGVLYYLDNPEQLNASKKPFWWDEFPIIIDSGDMQIIHDGNHRATAALVLKEKLKSTVVHLSKEEELPLKPALKPILQTASPDFGYSKYNDRDTDLSKLEIVETTDDAGDGHSTAIALAPAEMYPYSSLKPGKKKLVGYVEVCPWGDEKTYFVGDISIDEEWRGTGLGQMLYDQAIKMAKDSGAIYLSSSTDMQSDAKRAWTRLSQRYPVKVVNDSAASFGKRWVIDLSKIAAKKASNYWDDMLEEPKYKSWLLNAYKRTLNEPWVEYVPVSQLLPLREYHWSEDKNRDGAERFVDMVDSIKQNGVRSPITIKYFRDANMAYIEEGNHRLAAAVKAGLTEVPAQVHVSGYGWKDRGDNSDADSLGAKVRGLLDPNAPIYADYIKPSDIGLTGHKKTATAKTAYGERWFHGTSAYNAKSIIATGRLDKTENGGSNWDGALVSRPGAVYVTNDLEVAWEYARTTGDGDGAVVFEVEVDPHTLIPDEDSVSSALKRGNIKGDYRTAAEVRKVWLAQYNESVSDEEQQEHFDFAFKPYFQEMEEGWSEDWPDAMFALVDYIASTDPTLTRDIIEVSEVAAHIGPLKVIGTVDAKGNRKPLQRAASHKQTPFSDTTFPNMDKNDGEGSNAYALQPERVEGNSLMPSLEAMVPGAKLAAIPPTKIMYHVSKKGNRQGIKTRGLLPMIKEFPDLERQPGVYLLETLEQAEDWAFWFGFSEPDAVVIDIWEVQLPEGVDVRPDTTDMDEVYDSWVTYKAIPVANLKLVKSVAPSNSSKDAPPKAQKVKRGDLEGDGAISFFEPVENEHSVQPLRASFCKGASDNELEGLKWIWSDRTGAFLDSWKNEEGAVNLHVNMAQECGLPFYGRGYDELNRGTVEFNSYTKKMRLTSYHGGEDTESVINAIRAHYNLSDDWRVDYTVLHPTAKTGSIKAIRRGNIDPAGAYFSLPGSSTYHDEDSVGIDPNIHSYDVSGLNIADTSKLDVTTAIIEEALKTANEQDKARLEALLKYAKEEEPVITYMDNDELPLSDAAKRLGYEGILVWENDDIASPSSAFIWDVGKVRKIALSTPPKPFPTRNFKKLWHVGTMDISKKNKGSHEGDGLSVSPNPEAWEMISHSTGDLWELTKPGNLFLDFYRMSKAQRRELNQWGVKQGYVEATGTWEACHYDDELEDTMCSEYPTLENLLYEEGYDSIEAAKEDDIDVTQKTEGVSPTGKLSSRMGEPIQQGFTMDFLTMVYAEDVLNLDGVWWNEALDVDRYSAPRAVIFNAKVPTWTKQVVTTRGKKATALVSYSHGSLPTWEEFVASEGGFKKLLYAMGDADSHYAEWLSMEHPDSEPDEEDVLRYAEADLRNRYEDIVSDHEFRNFPMAVYREVTLKDINELRLNHIGECWAWDENKAGAHWGSFGNGSEPFILRAEIKATDVDWPLTLFLNIDPSIGEEEAEIRLHKGARIKLTGWRRRNERGKWQLPLPSWKNVTASQGQNPLYEFAEDARNKVFGAGPAKNGDCEPTADALYDILNANGYDASIAYGHYGNAPHSWVQVGDTYIDPTHDQFDKKDIVIGKTTDNYFKRKYELNGLRRYAGAGDSNLFIPRHNSESPALHTDPLFPDNEKTELDAVLPDHKVGG